MGKQLPPLDLLIGFEAAARQLSFSKAGEEVFVTQSAISRQVKKLEEYIGHALFERHHRALALTEQGKVLHEAASEALSRLATTIESLRKDPTEKSIRISTTSSFAALWLVPRLARFKALHPDIAMSISADNRVVDLTPGIADLAVRYCTPEVANAVDHVLLSREVVFPVCSPSLLRERGTGITKLSDLSGCTLLHLTDKQNVWPWLQWPNWIKAAGGAAKPIGAELRFSHFDQMIQAAVMGHGVALGASPLVDYLMDQGLLVAPLPQRVVSPRAFFLRQGDRSDPVANAVSAWLLRSLQ